MKVLMISMDSRIFEPHSAVLDRIKEYSNFCDNLTVIVLTRQSANSIHIKNLSIYPASSIYRARRLFLALNLAKKIIREEKITLITTQDPFDTGIIGWLMKRKYNLPWQCQLHGDIFSPYFWQESLLNKARVILAKFMLPKADGIRTVSERIKYSLVRMGLKVKPIVLPILVDVGKLQLAEIKTDLKQKYPQFNFLILMASRLSKEKNIELAIKAMVQIVQKYPKAGLIVVGEGRDAENLRSFVQCYGLDKNVVFESWSQDLVSYYKTADMFLLTSNYEGWGMTVVEAAACACPIVMTDVGCAGEFIKNEQNGFVVNVGDEKGLISVIIKLTEDKNLAKDLGMKAQNSTHQLLDKDKYLNLYKTSLIDITSYNKT